MKFNSQKTILVDPKALEVVLFLSKRLGKPTFHQILKLVYFADRYHLEHYGRFIMPGDHYVAMKHGPVLSNMYDFFKEVRQNNSYPDSIMVQDKYYIKTLREPNVDLLSISERKSLEYALELYGTYNFSMLTEASHDNAWQAADENDLMSIESIASTLQGAQEILEYLKRDND